MSVGDPDLPTIERIIEHAVTRLYRGRTHYSPGMGEPALREKIAEIEVAASGKPTTPNEVIIFPGATNALFTVLSCLLDDESEVIITEPAYVGYHGILSAIGAAVVPVRTNSETGFSLDVSAIKAAATPQTRVLLINTPGNPSGHVIEHEALNEICAWAHENNIWVVCDEVYSMLTFEKPFCSARRAADRLDNVIIVDGLSKSHAMTGWRLGWVVAPESVIPSLLAFTSATVFGCSQFIQDAAAFALENDTEYIESIRQEYQSRRDYAMARIDAIEGLSCHQPEAGMFAMVDVSDICEDGGQFARSLLDGAGVSVLPGEGFGQQTRQYVRVSLTHGIETLEPAFDRIERYCKER